MSASTPQTTVSKKATAAIAKKIAELKAIKVSIAALTAQEKALNLEVRDLFKGANILTDGSGTVLATLFTKSVERFDQKAFEAAHPKLFIQFKKESPTSVLLVK